MIESMELLWSLMTVFFNETVIYYPLFSGMFLLNIVFGCCYLLKYIFEQMERF